MQKNITTIKSHIQVLKQCEEWLENYFPFVVLEETKSTISAIEDLLKEKNSTTAVIASREAGEAYNLKILAEI